MHQEWLSRYLREGYFYLASVLGRGSVRLLTGRMAYSVKKLKKIDSFSEQAV